MDRGPENSLSVFVDGAGLPDGLEMHVDIQQITPRRPGWRADKGDLLAVVDDPLAELRSRSAVHRMLGDVVFRGRVGGRRLEGAESEIVAQIETAELPGETGLRPVTQVSINETWSALRYRPGERVGKR